MGSKTVLRIQRGDGVLGPPYSVGGQHGTHEPFDRVHLPNQCQELHEHEDEHKRPQLLAILSIKQRHKNTQRRQPWTPQ